MEKWFSFIEECRRCREVIARFENSTKFGDMVITRWRGNSFEECL